MKELVDHIIVVVHDSGLPITSLQLQKILYFTLRNSRRYLDEDTLREAYSGSFLVWGYRPAVESQYNRFYSYGSSPVIDSFNQVSRYENLNQMILHFLKIDMFRMIGASHTHKSWKENSPRMKFGRSDIEYPLEEILCDNQ